MIKLRFPGLAAVLAASAALATASLGTGASAADPDPRVEQAERLAVEPSVDRNSPADVAAHNARRVAEGAARRVPLPLGGNFNGIQWEQAGGRFSMAEIEAALEYNAFCQWLRHRTSGQDSSTASAVLMNISNWPALRGSGSASFIRQVLAEERSGGGPSLDGALRDCEMSHQREVAHAESLGLPPSS